MKDLEKIFYGNIVAYDSAMLPEAKSDEMSKVIWRLDLKVPVAFCASIQLTLGLNSVANNSLVSLSTISATFCAYFLF